MAGNCVLSAGWLCLLRYRQHCTKQRNFRRTAGSLPYAADCLRHTYCCCRSTGNAGRHQENRQGDFPAGAVYVCILYSGRTYRDYYEKLAQLNIDVCEDILTILEAMHFPDSHPDFNPRYFYNPLRKALEYIFRAAREVDVLPDVFFNGGKVNLNQCFMFAIGKDAEKLGYKHGDGGFTPIHIQNMMSLIINLGNSNSHSFNSSHSTELTEKEVLNYANHIKAIGGNSKLLIFSIALQFCEILQWMNNFIKDHPDKEENRKRWELIGENRNCPTGIVEKHDGFFHIGEDYSALLQNDDLLGKKVQILNSIPNTNPRTKKYKFFVRESDLKVIDDADKGPM